MTDMDDLPYMAEPTFPMFASPFEVGQSIKTFYQPNPRAACYKLNDIQRAFVKWTVKRALTNGKSITVELVTHTITEGVNEFIWRDAFRPADVEDFDKCLLDRMKNKRKTFRRQELHQSQEKTLASFIQDCVGKGYDALESATADLVEDRE